MSLIAGACKLILIRNLARVPNLQSSQVLDLLKDFETVACGRAHAGAVTSIQWTADERQLVSAAEDCTLGIWNFFGETAPPACDPSSNPSHDPSF